MRKRGADIELNMGELPAIPAGWKWGRVEDAASAERNAIVDGPFGSNLKLSDYIEPPGVPVLTTANLRGDYGPTSVRYISQMKFEELRRSEVRGGDILVAKIGSCGLTGVYPEGMPSAIIPANLLKMTVHPETSRKFILYYLNSPTFSRFLKMIITATAQPAFNVSKFRQLPLPVVPRSAQNIIVAEIEKQFTRLDAGVAALRRVQANLKRYRAAVLKAACEGRLVPTEAELAKTGNQKSKFETGEELLARILTERRKKWQGRGQYKEPSALDTTRLSHLPNGWTWATLNSIIREPLRNGHSAKATGTEKGLRVFTLSAVTEGDFSEENTKLSVATPEKVADLWAEPGDIYVERSNTPELVGIARLYKGPPRFAFIPDLFIRVRVASPVLERYVEMCLLSERGRTFFRSRAQGISGTMPKIDQETVELAPIPFPPLAEQKRIVAEVERRLSVVDELEAVVSADLQRAARLRQSVLHKAFSGELSGAATRKDAV